MSIENFWMAEREYDPEEAYYNEADGLYYCVDCKTPVEAYFVKNEKGKHPCMCKCRREEHEQREKERKTREHADTVDKLRQDAFSGKRMHDWNFENSQADIKQIEVAKKYADTWLEFARKHLSDKFFLENEVNVSLRNILAREMIGNTLMHREFTSTYAAKFVIEKDRMYVENASRASKQGLITPENLEPNPKNPIISAFFRNIGRADRLGSGVRNLYKYSKFYSGEEPNFMEGDVFRIVVPLNDEYSFDFGTGTADKKPESADKVPINADKTLESADKVPINADKTSEDGLTLQQKSILQYVRENGKITSHQAELLLQVKQRRARVILGEMVDAGLLEKQGAYKATVYTLK